MSKEYIDKSALYEKIAQLEELARNRYLETPSSSLCFSRYMTQLNERTALKHIVADFPSADVVPVVRCQDCVYARPLKDMNYDYLCHYWNGHSCNQNQFCSQGKRKEDENEKKDTDDK